MDAGMSLTPVYRGALSTSPVAGAPAMVVVKPNEPFLSNVFTMPWPKWS